MSTVCPVKIERRDRLFYEQFLYSFQFRQHEVFALRGMPDNLALLKFVELRRSWVGRLSMYKNKNQECFTAESIENLMSTRDLLVNWPAEFKFTVTYDWATIYTNDINLVGAVARLPHVLPARFVKQAVVDRPKDVVVIKNPKYQYRTYLREHRMTEQAQSQLLSWLLSQQDHDGVLARPSKALLGWLNGSRRSWRHQWCQRYYYIEHNDLRYETMLAMILPGAVRKSSRVISTEENLLAVGVAK